jgi:hypothetical protein
MFRKGFKQILSNTTPFILSFSNGCSEKVLNKYYQVQLLFILKLTYKKYGQDIIQIRDTNIPTSDV